MNEMPLLTSATRLSTFAQGDLAAFESLFREHQREVYGWIVRIVRDAATAEELTLETFWRIWKTRARFDPHQSFERWARRIATNLALRHLKHHTPERPLLVEPVAAAVPDPVASAETLERVRRAFRELPPKLRIAATLALVEERKYEDIAAVLGISVGGVKSRVFRAVRILRRKLERMGIEP
jgi:RNA polymerase sigma factor (sigma-70 family)